MGSIRGFRASLVVIAAWIFIVLCAVHSTDAMWIHPEQNDTAPVFLSTPRLRYLDPPGSEDWNSRVFEGEWVYLRSKHEERNLTGKILMYDLGSGESQEDAIRYFEKRGVVALFTILRVTTPHSGAGNWIRDGTKPTTHNFPSYELTLTQNKSMEGWYSNQSRIWVSVGYDVNPWDNTYRVALPIVGIYILIFSGAILVLALWKQMILILKNGFQLSMAQSVLWVNIVGCGLRVIWCAADPFGSSETTNFLFLQVMLSISYPFAVGGALLISLYWHEMIVRSGNKINLFLDRLRWPFFAWCAFMICFELATSVLRGSYYSFTIMVFLDGAMYIVVSLAVLVFFAITRHRLQKVFQKLNEGLRSRPGERLTLATFQLQAMVAMMIFWIIFLVLIGATNLMWTPIAFPTLWAFFFFTLQITCLFQVILIKIPPITPHRVYRALFKNEPILAFRPFSSASMGSRLTPTEGRSFSQSMSPRSDATSDSQV
jgi:hypothetical protein